MNWRHKDLLEISQLSRDEVEHVFETAARFAEVNQRPIKKVPILKGKSVVLFFAEASTRTKTSFDMAGKRLSADTFSLTKSGSSLQKGESLKDTALTLQAMHPDAIVIRHWDSGAAAFLAQRLECSIINAGDGWHAHPTQALLDGFTLSRVWDSFAGKTVCILGDIAHSRVARSDVQLLTMLGVRVRLCAPGHCCPPRPRHGRWRSSPMWPRPAQGWMRSSACVCSWSGSRPGFYRICANTPAPMASAPGISQMPRRM